MVWATGRTGPAAGSGERIAALGACEALCGICEDKVSEDKASSAADMHCMGPRRKREAKKATK